MKSAIIVHSNIMKKVDGMANYYRGLCEYAAASNHKIDIFLLGNQREKKIPEKSVKFYFVPTDTSFQLLPNAFLPLSPVFYLKLLWYFHSTFKSERYECIQISSAHPFCFTAVLVAKRLNIPVVGSYHTLLPEYVPYWTQEKFSGIPCGRLLAKLLHVLVAIWTYQVYGLSDLIVSPTSKVQQYLHNKFPRTRIAVIGRGVDSDLFKPLPKRNAPLRLLYVGRISVEKNLEQLSFLKNHKDLHLSVVGEGSDMDRMKEVLPFAEFKGKLENCELAWEYGSSDIFIFPSRTDAYANVASEALSSGLPVIAFDDAGRELIDLDPVIRYNKSNLLTHAKNLDYIPRDNEYYQILDQASHTYGCVFKDRNHEITADLDAWMNAMCASADEFYFGRFDMKLRDSDSLSTGEGVKICEVNG